jgi:hypothetical protein
LVGCSIFAAEVLHDEGVRGREGVLQGRKAKQVMTLQGRTKQICVKEVVNFENFRRGNALAYMVEPCLKGTICP